MNSADRSTTSVTTVGDHPATYGVGEPVTRSCCLIGEGEGGGGRSQRRLWSVEGRRQGLQKNCSCRSRSCCIYVSVTELCRARSQDTESWRSPIITISELEGILRLDMQTAEVGWLLSKTCISPPHRRLNQHTNKNHVHECLGKWEKSTKLS